MGRYITGFASAGIAIGYFFNIYVLLAISALLVSLFVIEARRSNTMPGTSGKMGGMIIGLLLWAVFFVPAWITSVIVNRELILSFFQAIARGLSVLLLR